jgi:hypothetical protein
LNFKCKSSFFGLIIYFIAGAPLPMGSRSKDVHFGTVRMLESFLLSGKHPTPERRLTREEVFAGFEKTEELISESLPLPFRLPTMR